MKKELLFIFSLLVICICSIFSLDLITDPEKYNELTPQEASIILKKGTEPPFSGEYNNFYKDGYYHCKQCNQRLYRSKDKFDSETGWPSFDDEVEGAITRKKEFFSRRLELLCSNCGAHLGHLFKGEGFTSKNVRHCINSLSLTFVPFKDDKDLKKAYVAGGCFWGVEHLFEGKDGVIRAVSGFMGGDSENPTYEEVLKGDSGFLETVEVTYDPEIVSYEEIIKFFFEIHDPTQIDGQGPDIGSQYLSAVFYQNEDEKATTEKLIKILKEKGYDVVTKVLSYKPFWEADLYHQDYYKKSGKQPYCHFYNRKF